MGAAYENASSGVSLSELGVRLRPVGTADYGFLYDLSLSSSNISRYMFRGETPSPESFVLHLWNGVICQFLVTADQDDMPLGMVVCYGESARQKHAKIAVLSSSADRRGVTVRALCIFIDYLFFTFGYRKLYADVLEPNLDQFASGLGSAYEIQGRLVDHEYLDGAYVDLCLLAIPRQRWVAHPWRAHLARIVGVDSNSVPGWILTHG